MSYMEMELRNETGEASTKGICLNFGNFIDDLDFSSDMDYYQSEEYPIERYHAKMRSYWKKQNADSRNYRYCSQFLLKKK